ncbi:DUF6338 family protein [Bradyrhizobium jicamae]|uniref:DUF6338 family protein n=1 Tax=Bradyrhizobium jicamae TaxID=280332 RepID=UPI001BA9D763|nr:DUF6338 family protein [Bradyrhizobium jicamae]MBR0934346.1 hypothetical protein [Bradyrhizobium jicamae]
MRLVRGRLGKDLRSAGLYRAGLRFPDDSKSVRRLGKDQLLTYVTLSGVTFALWGWIIYVVYKYSENIPFKAGAWILVIIAIPGVSGAAMGICNQRDYFRKALHHAGLTPAHSIPSAWDYKFSRARGEWLLVTLKNGTQFAGWWAGQSFASDERSERDR